MPYRSHATQIAYLKRWREKRKGARLALSQDARRLQQQAETARGLVDVVCTVRELATLLARLVK